MLAPILTYTLAGLLLAPAPSGAPPPPELIADEQPQSPKFTAALEHLAQVDTEISRTEDPLASADALIEALAALTNYAPEVAASPSARDLRQLARLNLARTYMLAGKDDLAIETMDETIREAMGDEVNAGMFGPSLSDLYQQRMAALDERGRATLVVTCARPCRVYINETAAAPDEPPSLPLGSYRVWIEDATEDLPRRRVLVNLSEAEQVYEVDYAPLPVPEAPAKPEPKPDRIMPRGAELALIVLGAGLTATGAVLVAGNKHLQVGPMIGGVLGLAVGAGMLTSGSIALTVDERKLARGTSHQATLSWNMRF
ncbi:hypothetical protein DB30_01346 [Enhygromyxa salina]|uniref:PEGA domain-containing protein n=1 Tax=Enhygromyxa salina TaxID=215803 RepID=A0A0C2DF30_9BACT|nr:hypothetical protein [Enhygromyxa salina]KIG18237.1 hypothetical protein DB30_01346 [Enhygromyxa salina]